MKRAISFLLLRKLLTSVAFPGRKKALLLLLAFPFERTRVVSLYDALLRISKEMFEEKRYTLLMLQNG